jgi:phospholipid/cholesterol/gamma-HCH transport system substrate-binding protein
MLESDPRRRLRVGLFTAGLLALFGVSVLLIGQKQQLFVRQVTYRARFVHVGGLVAGAPVWLNGVVVGAVDDVALPPDPAQREILVTFRIDAKMARRMRADSKVTIRTLGLLGDRYLEVTSGTPSQPKLKDGSEVQAVQLTDVAAVLSQGGDVVSNVLAISGSLRRILERVEHGEGLIGELTMDPDSGRLTVTRLVSLMEQVDGLLRDVRAGRGALGKLLTDPELERRLVDDIAGMAAAGRRVAEALAADLDRDDSAVAALLRDPQGRARVERVLDGAGAAAESLAAVGRQLNEGDGTLARLLADEQFAGDFLDNLAQLTKTLRTIAEKLDRGDGTAGRMLNDPQLWEDLEHVVRGVNESKVVSWFVRNRREAGEKAEAKEEAAAAAASSPTPAPGE